MPEQRHDKRWDLVLYLPVVNRSNGEILGYLSDITIQGLMILSETPMSAGQHYSLEIRLDKLNPQQLTQQSSIPIHFDAETRWCNQVNTHLFSIGFKVVDIPPEGVDGIQQVINHIGVYKFVDIMIHLDQALDDAALEKAKAVVLNEKGVMTANYELDNPHLLIVQYELGETGSAKILKSLTQQDIAAELVVL